MSIYSKYCLPKIINLGCGSKPIQKQREKVVPRCYGRVLEVGVGTGLNFPYYDKNAVEELFALDPHPEMISQACKKSKRLDLKTTFLRAFAENIPLKNDVMDTVLLTYTLCTVANPKLVLSEIRRVLKPSGKLIFCEHGYSPDQKVEKWQNRINMIWPTCVGGCNLNRKIENIIKYNKFKIGELNTMYLPGTPKWFGYNYWGVASISK